MVRKARWWIAGFGLAAVSGAALACADNTCEAKWKLASRGGDCANRAILSPGNDTRVNLMLLLRSRPGAGTRGLSYPKLDWDSGEFGQTFLSWNMLRSGLFPAAAHEEDTPGNPHAGSRCASLAAGTPAFLGILSAARDVTVAERTALSAARGRLEQVCSQGDGAPAAQWPGGIVSASGTALLGYLKASDAFYAGRWDEARSAFAALRAVRQPWVAETAAYMLGRVELNAAIEKAFGEYGYFEGAKAVDQSAVARASAALEAYLKAYPAGAYAASAQGLKRRALWLSGDREGLGNEYARLLLAVRPDAELAAELVQEVDNKLLFDNGEAQAMLGSGPAIVAVQALLALRNLDRFGDAREGPGLSLAALAERKAAFAGQEDLYTYLQASHAYYVAGDMRRVLQLIPDDARAAEFTPLAFSRQVLRGMALAALGDPNEAGFWREMLGGANGLWQRPTVELGLAMNYERRGRLAEVFAPNSPILDTTIRMILLRNAAGPEILRAQALNRARPLAERQVALFVLLDKQLARGDYAGFLANRTIALPAREDDSGQWDRSQLLPSFAAGKWSDGYACGPLAETAAQLARNPRDSRARLCLGDFWRINGFDEGRFATPVARDELGGAGDLFPGKATPRGAIYADIIADARAPAPDKAYALYRAVMCYAPGGNNACGNADVPRAQRQAWFQRLKRDYPASPWAQRLRYYW